MLRVCIASMQNVERSLLLLVVSASDIPLRTIKFFSVLFSSAYWSMLQAVTNKHSLVRRRLCDLRRNCFCHFVVSTSSNRSIASGAWATVSYSASTSVNVFGTSHVQKSSIASYTPYTPPQPIPHLHSTPPLGGFPSEYRHPVWCGKTNGVATRC